MLALTRLGEFRSLAAICGLATAFLLWFGKRREGLFLIACGSGAALGGAALKLAFHRGRPNLTHPYLVTLPHSFSFPSGHALGSMVVVGSLVVVVCALRVAKGWRFLAILLALPVIFGVAASRVYLGVHYASDVLGGQLAGAAWVAAMTGWFFPRLLPAEQATVEPPGPASSQ